MDRSRIFPIILILMLLGGGYYYYQVYSVAPTTEGGSQVIAEADSRLNEIRPLASVQLDTSIFDNPFFHSLRPLTAAASSSVLPGRSNPFVAF